MYAYTVIVKYCSGAAPRFWRRRYNFASGACEKCFAYLGDMKQNTGSVTDDDKRQTTTVDRRQGAKQYWPIRRASNKTEAKLTRCFVEIISFQFHFSGSFIHLKQNAKIKSRRGLSSNQSIAAAVVAVTARDHARRGRNVVGWNKFASWIFFNMRINIVISLKQHQNCLCVIFLFRFTCTSVWNWNKTTSTKQCASLVSVLLPPRKRGNVFTGVGLCGSVCLSVTTITKTIADGFAPNFMRRFLREKGRPSLCFVTIGRGMWK